MPDLPDLKSQLLDKLHGVCELEHQFMCQYLYAAYTMKKRYVADQHFDNIDAAGLETVRRWLSTVYLVARQEMEHLALAQNLSTAIGGSPNFGRDNIEDINGGLMKMFRLGAAPSENAANIDCDALKPIDQPFIFKPFDLETARRWTCMESPNCEALKKEQPDKFANWCFEPKDQDAALLAGQTPEEVAPGDIQEAYDEIEAMFRCLPADAYVSNATSQPDIIQQYDIYVFPVTDLNSAVQAIDLITKQGEGNKASTTYESHYRRFYDIQAEYRAILDQYPDFKPYWNVRTVHDSALIENDFSRDVFDLYNVGYSILLSMLTGLYGTFNQQPGSYPHFAPALGQESFAPYMTMIIRSLAEVLVQLKFANQTDAVGDDIERVGPNFHLSRQFNESLRHPFDDNGNLLPVFGDIERILANTESFNERLRKLSVRLAELIASGASPLADPALENWARERLEYIQSNADRISVNLRRIYQQGIYKALDGNGY